ncbi:hypothetical protein EOM09_00940 [bacterium]|nr:hypothetical protein [bacterium]
MQSQKYTGKNNTDITEVAKIHEEIKKMDVATVVVSENKVSFSRKVEGLELSFSEKKDSLILNINVLDNTIIKNPVDFCFGSLNKNFNQNLKIKFNIGKSSYIKVYSFCIFPNADSAFHIMNGNIKIGENSTLEYIEKHTHNENSSNLNVNPKSNILVSKNAKFITRFEILKGNVGNLKIDYQIKLMEGAICDSNVALKMSGKDTAEIKENVFMNENNSKSVLISKIASFDNSVAKVFNYMESTGKNNLGHIECHEILQNKGEVSAYPCIKVTDSSSRITHEASLGGVDNKKLESLMSKGLTKKKAENLLISALLKS